MFSSNKLSQKSKIVSSSHVQGMQHAKCGSNKCMQLYQFDLRTVDQSSYMIIN